MVKRVKLPDNITFFLKNSFYVGLSNIVSLISPIIAIPFLVETVGLSNYGLSTIALSLSMITVSVINFGFDISGVNRIAKDKTKKHTIETVLSITYAKIFLFLLVLFFSTLVFILIPAARIHLSLFFCSLIIPLSALFNFNWALQGLEKFKHLSLFTILGKAIFLAGVFTTITSDSDYIFINVWVGLGTIVTGGLSLGLIFKTQSKGIKSSFSGQVIFKELKSSREYFITNISIYLSMYLFPFIIGVLTTSTMAGIYAIIEKIYTLLRTSFGIYQSIMHPRISSLIEQSRKKAKKAIMETYVFVVVFVLVAILGIVVFQDQVVEYFVNEYYDITRKAMLLSFLGLLFVSINCPIYLMALALDAKKEIMKISLKTPIIGVLFCGVSVHFFGIFGAVYALIFIEAIYAILLLISFKIKLQK